ncbi:pyridoxal phosphate-dependent aminotransferase [Roseospira marina]|uniref:Aminotransferase n=1 Tax=Roseospira marina TaxID=140057 RepID=A0A5M6IHD9_9PROT|nr:pyridoxal phosphate-dependent aminotransferase [Roseospira marina]KAA5607582.1 pyridoxal phosphate-dependent aminotransferase [Roseospira marina]MBB4312226.1 aspartate aminotransferase [Roseospira marina]MBB5085758.1 aspartate aminotransferase [Roseospira marina]
MSLLSTRLSVVAPSPTIAITRLAGELRRQGRDVIGLSQGEPDFDTPQPVKDAAKAAIDRGETKYTDVDGTSDLKQAIVEKFARDNGLTYGLDQISVGTGGKQVLFNALYASVDIGQEVIIPAPYWVSYPDMVRLVGGVPVVVPCPEEQGFLLDADSLRAAITPRTKWLILNSPSNPTGAGYDADRLRALADVLLEHPHVHVLSDDMYEHIRYDGWAFTTIAAVEPRLAPRVLTVNGVSKAYAMTGWRIGYAGGPAPLIKAMATVQSQSTSNPSSVSQAAAAAALRMPLDFLEERNAAFRERRDLCLAAFNAIDGLSCQTPQGAFYLFPSCAGLLGRKTPAGRVLDSDVAVAEYLMEAANVAVVPGTAFGLAPYFRVSFATSLERLRVACARIADACDTLS